MKRQSKFYIFSKLICNVMGILNMSIATMLFVGKGFSFTQISLVYSILLLCSLVFEYPSGVLADRYGRKKIYAIGLLFVAVQYAAYAFADSFGILLIAAAFAGIGDALISGSLEAWLFYEEEYSRVSIKKSLSINKVLSNVVSMLFGLFFAYKAIEYKSIYIALAIIVVLLSIISFILFKDNKGEVKSVKSHAKESFKIVYKDDRYLLMIAVVTLSISFYSAFVLYWAPLLNSIGIDKSYNSLIYSSFLLGGILSNTVFSKVFDKLSRQKYLILTISFMFLGFFLMNTRQFYFSIAGLFVFGLGQSSLMPYVNSWIAEFITGEYTATIVSLINTIGAVASIGVNIIVGVLIDNYGLNSVFVFVLIITISSLYLITRQFEKKEVDISQ